MAKYVLIYHGGAQPEDVTDEERMAIMTAWGTWMEGLGEALTDRGNWFGNSTTVQSDGSTKHGGGTNPATGYGMLDADSLDAAAALAAGCPSLDSGGTIEVAEAMEM